MRAISPEERVRNQELRSKLISETFRNHPHYGPDNGQVATDESMDDTAETREAIKKQGAASSAKRHQHPTKTSEGDDAEIFDEDEKGGEPDEDDKNDGDDSHDMTLSEARREYKALTGKAPNAKWSADHIAKLIEEEKAGKK